MPLTNEEVNAVAALVTQFVAGQVTELRAELDRAARRSADEVDAIQRHNERSNAQTTNELDLAFKRIKELEALVDAMMAEKVT